MSVFTDIKLMVVSDRKPYTADRLPIYAIKKDQTELISGEQFANQSAVEGLIKRIKDDGKHAFQLLWKPEEKYGTLFNALKGEKSKVTISLYFFLRNDNATGKLLWNAIATAGGVTIGNCSCNGKSTNTLEVVDITANSFS
jgi:hypothetical protein